MTTPIAQYLFEGNANDALGGFNGSFTNNPVFEKSPRTHSLDGGVVVLNGSALSLPAIPTIANNNARTFEWWMCLISKPSARMYAVMQGRSYAGEWFSFVPFDLTTNMVSYPQLYWGNKTVLFAKSTIPIGVWQHYVLAHAQGGTYQDVKLYINAAKQTITEYIGGGKDGSGNVTVNTYNGNINFGSNGDSKYNNLRIYNSVLSESEISEHYLLESQPAPSEQYLLLPRRSRDLDYLTKVRS